MSSFFQLALIFVTVALLIFWIWMFGDMTKNEHIPPHLKSQWFFAFIFLNVFAAILYYITVYAKQE